MSQTKTYIVEGWTEALQYRLDADATPKDLTGLTVIPYCEDRTGVVVSSSDEITINDTTGGIVSWNPLTTDTLQASKQPYILQFLVYDGSDVGVFPSGEPVLLSVRPLGHSV